MGKKKTPDQEENKLKENNGTADNKTNKENKEPADVNVSVKDADTDTEKQSPEAAAPELESPDKVVSEKESFEAKLAEMQDKYLRLSAEFDNYRKRTLREKMELSKYAREDLLLKILPVMDDFERAISHLETTTDCSAMKDGIDLIYGKFNEFLKQSGVREIEALNCPFNFELHDAVAKIAVTDEDKKGKIVDVIQKGYYLQDKIIRHSKVVVGE